MRRIPLVGEAGAGKYALVDDEDFEWLSQYRWHYREGYAGTFVRRPDGSWDRNVRMHRLIMGAKPGELVDHRDRQPLNNQRHNLRYASYGGNAQNSNQPLGATQYRGVTLKTDRERPSPYEARINVGKKRITIGKFRTAVEAARAYDRKAVELHGEYAVLNFPEEWTDK